MPATRSSPYDIDDAKHFDANLEAYFGSLVAEDAQLAEVLKRQLTRLLSGEIDRPALWDALYAAAAEDQP